MNKIIRKKARKKTKKQSNRVSFKTNENNDNIILNEESIKEEKKESNANKLNKLINKSSYPQQLGEIIAKIILDKIIAITVRKCENNEANAKLENHYFNYIINQISTFLSINNIFYTEEPEYLMKYEYVKCWKPSYRKSNTWVEIIEPKPSKVDRHDGYLAKYIPLENNDNDNSKKKNNSNSHKKEKKIKNNKKHINGKKTRNTKKFKNLLNNLESLEEVSLDSGEEGKIHIKKEKRFSIINSSINKTIKEYTTKKNNDNINLRKSLSPKKRETTRRNKFDIFDFSSEDIPDIQTEFNYDKYDPPNVDFLRQEFERELKDKEEINKILTLNKITNLRRGSIVKPKMFDSDKLTFDSDGKIINFKQININSLANDFRKLTHKLSNLKPLNINKLPLPINIMRKTKRRSSDIISRDSLNVIKNPDDDPELNETLYIKINPEKKTKIIQSGNNFSLMLPSVGVIMKDKDKVKKGNREFGKYFKKYSLEDFDKILRVHLPKENKALMEDRFKQLKSNSVLNNNKNNFGTTSMNNSGNFYNNSFDFPNPLLNQDNQEINETNLSNINNTINRQNTNNTKNRLYHNMNKKNLSMNNSSNFINNNSYLTNKRKKLRIFNPNLNGFIQIKNANSLSLKLELESLNDLDFKNHFFSPNNSSKKFENIFSKKFKTLIKKEKKENEISKDLNDLNKQIIRDVEWGKTIKKNMSSQNLFYSKHQSKYQVLKELRSNFINNFKLKLPRERKISVI